MILLNEATTDQIVQELKDRCEYMVILINKNQNNGQFMSLWKGDFIQRVGMANVLKTEIESFDMHYHFERLNSNDEEGNGL